MSLKGHEVRIPHAEVGAGRERFRKDLEDLSTVSVDRVTLTRS